jgi:hypothetical protein
MARAEIDDPLLAASGMIQGLPADLSANVDRAIEESFVATPASQAKKSRRIARAALAGMIRLTGSCA